MKLSKKGAAIQRAIHNALASGKALGGLLVGFAATVAGCGERHSPAHTMGRFPDSRYQENAKNENTSVEVQGRGPVIRGEQMPLPGEPPPPQPKPNAVREQQGKPTTIGKMPLSGKPPAPKK